MNNKLNFMFGMYEPTTDSVIVNADEKKENGLQDYVDGMNELN